MENALHILGIVVYYLILFALITLVIFLQLLSVFMKLTLGQIETQKNKAKDFYYRLKEYIQWANKPPPKQHLLITQFHFSVASLCVLFLWASPFLLALLMGMSLIFLILLPFLFL